MSEWKTYKLGDVGKIITGKTPSTSNSEYFGVDYPFITPKDMNGIKHIHSTERYISQDGVNAIKNNLLPANSICVSCIGSDLGKVVKTTQLSFTNQQLNSIICNDKFDSDFIYYACMLLSEKLRIIGKASTAVPIVNKSSFSNFEIQAPDLPTQKEIASILSSLDDKIELNLQMNQTLEAMAQAIFKEWFVNFNFPGFDGELENGLPKGWKMGIFEELTDIKTGKGLKRTEFRPDGIYPIIGANGELGRTDEYLLDDKLLLTGRVGTLGSIKISYGKKWYSDNVLIMKPYKYFYFTYFNLKAIDMNSLNRGSTQPLVTQTDLKNYLTLIPNDEIILLFEKTVNGIFEKIFFNDIQIQTLTQTRDTLLPKLMSGKISLNRD